MNNSMSCSDGRWCMRADALLGVEGIHIRSVTAIANGLDLRVETGETLSGCPACGIIAIGHGRRHVRLHDLEEAWALAKDKPQGQTKFLNKYAAFTLLAIDEWLLNHPDEGIRSMLLELLERRYDTASTVFCTEYAKKDWHQRLGFGVHADAIMDRIVHNTIWVDIGNHNMRQHATMNQ